MPNFIPKESQDLAMTIETISPESSSRFSVSESEDTVSVKKLNTKLDSIEEKQILEDIRTPYGIG
jgi:hypothetical protein